ncbi:MAG TPA: bifunctional pyr operon transcriptional regulator/uracil phosphoribosyltransferase PyrR [Saprospiraceae bacterium]|nr:bifunctional pyr operon transcriptional regulator/uracil phosphoribosyltransferase PyrR [Saprospiraceae bacterium]HMQ83034.1 bifunctional pyr operon transcriptional regulator/uracil phosphoribosyltransferase PyrR [Saprospiraceae bacterium]
MDKGRIIIEPKRFEWIIERLCQQLIEEHQLFEQSCLIGIQPRGVLLADYIYERLRTLLGTTLLYGKLDITFYRDDFRTREKPLSASKTEMDFLVDRKRVILVDDVLYTGRTVQAALTALNHYGRPDQVELLALVDRRFNRHLPIQSDYTGMTIDSLDEAYVKVEWQAAKHENRVLLFAQKTDAE